MDKELAIIVGAFISNIGALGSAAAGDYSKIIYDYEKIAKATIEGIQELKKKWQSSSEAMNDVVGQNLDAVCETVENIYVKRNFRA